MRQSILLLIAGIGVSSGVMAYSHASQESSVQAGTEHPLAVRTTDPQLPTGPEDGKTPGDLIAAMYDVVSGPAAKARDWQRMYSLFFPGAVLIRTARGKSGELEATVLSPGEYVTRAGKFFETHAFYERETSRKSHSWENLEQVFSMYESSQDPAYAKPFASGVNSIELFNDGKRWWITAIMWQEKESQTTASRATSSPID
jgi:hypothetical protein